MSGLVFEGHNSWFTEKVTKKVLNSNVEMGSDIFYIKPQECVLLFQTLIKIFGSPGNMASFSFEILLILQGNSFPLMKSKVYNINSIFA